MSSILRILVAAGFASAVLAAEPALVSVSHPDPADFEPSVREALQQGIEAFEDSRATGAGLARAYGQLGELYFAHHLSDAAESAFANAAALAPEAFRWRYLLGYARQQQGDLRAAIRDFALALELDPAYLPARLRLGEANLAAGELGMARESFEEVLEREPQSAAALAGLGRIALREKDHAAAIRWLGRALAIEPQATALYYPLALAHRHMGDRERARLLMNQRGERNPVVVDPLLASVGALSQSVQSYLELGYAAMRENRVSQAVDNFQQAVALAPEDLSARVSLAQALTAAGRSQDAMVEVEAALALDAGYAPARYRKGSLLELAGDLDAAEAEYRAAIGIDPGYSQARLLLAYALMRRHDFAAAAEEFAELSARQPGDVIVRYRLGLARLGAGDCEGAQAPLEEARQLNPRAGEILAALARTYATCDSAGEDKRLAALDAARLLYEARPQPEQAATLAMALAANGRFDQAAEMQAQLVDAERASAGADRLAALEENLARYRSGESAVSAWPAEAPVFDPPRPDPAADVEVD